MATINQQLEKDNVQPMARGTFPEENIIPSDCCESINRTDKGTAETNQDIIMEEINEDSTIKNFLNSYQ